MIRGWLVLLITTAYLMLLFLVAYFAEKRESIGRSLVNNPYVYALSMAVYCTSWTFYGSVGKAATSGLSFLTIYIGPTLMCVLFLVVMDKIIKIAKENRLTTISDFIGSRYGNSIALSAIVTIVASIGIAPYLGLQIKAIISTIGIISGETKGSAAAGWMITAIIGLFAVIFGVRRAEISEKHEGLVFAIAFESIIKLMAFLAVGYYVTFVLYNGHTEIFDSIKASEFSGLMSLGGGAGVGGYAEWAALTVLSMMAIMFLPRQFHMTVVENHDTAHLRKAMWLFPLYLLLINIFVFPVALGGLLLKGSAQGADSFVLTIPIDQGESMLALFVFIGGFSAASGMIIVESLAISNMIMNSIVNPAIYRFSNVRAFPFIVSTIKRAIIFGAVFMGYFFAVSMGEFYSLVDMGLKSFEAVTIFAPSILIGLYWKRGNAKGAMCGILAGFAVWSYTLFIPALVESGIITPPAWLSSLISSDMLNPRALFGLKGLDKWSHSLFWGLALNIGAYAFVSFLTQQSDGEEKQALLFVESYSPRLPSEKSSIGQIEEVLAEFIGRREARSVIDEFIIRQGVSRESMPQKELILLKEEAQRILSGALGSSIASLVLENRLMRTEQERSELLKTIRQMGKTLRLSRQELAEANRELAMLKEFSENIIESIPLGVATLDESLKITYWNRAMEGITGLDKSIAMGARGSEMLGCMTPDIFLPEPKEGDIACSTPTTELKGYVSRLTGVKRGFVIVLEDITDKKKIEEELYRATKHASIGRLAAGVSHEIGNPLASISSLVQELMAEEQSEFSRRSLSTIIHHIDRIARIVRSLGDFARLYPRQKVPTSIKDILDNTLNLVRFDKDFRKIDVHTSVDGAPVLNIDPDQIQQVFLNLILNARDAMPLGGRLDITIAQQNGALQMEFSDTGEGIPPDMRGKIFDPFFSTKGPAKGTGLGLSISYSIIKDHGGTIEMAAGAGEKGSRFIIRLPAAQTDADAGEGR